jgi:hypothetical protein
VVRSWLCGSCWCVCLAGGVLFSVVFVHVGNSLVCVLRVKSLEFLMSCPWLESVFAEVAVLHLMGSRKQCGSFSLPVEMRMWLFDGFDGLSLGLTFCSW